MSEVVPREWLKKRTTVAKEEARSLRQIYQMRKQYPGIEVPMLAFGDLNAKWTELVAAMLPGDELWEFESPPETWPKHGRVGLVVMRGDLVVASLISAPPPG
jgi:hypothetical protein